MEAMNKDMDLFRRHLQQRQMKKDMNVLKRRLQQSQEECQQYATQLYKLDLHFERSLEDRLQERLQVEDDDVVCLN